MTTITNAGPPPRPPAPHPVQWCVRVDGEDSDPERWMLSWATMSYRDITPPEIAVYEAALTRRRRPQYDGALRVRVWPLGPDDVYRTPPPRDAQTFVFPAGLPLALTPCPRHPAEDICPGCICTS